LFTIIRLPKYLMNVYVIRNAKRYL